MNIAFKEFGVTEIQGKNDNPEILKYFNDLGFDGAKLKDETAWCSAFVNWVCLKGGAKYTKKLNARSWLNVGVETETPEVGDIVIFWRESLESWKGHVGFYINQNENYIYVLGGNQNNQVNIKTYNKNRLLSIRKIT